VYEKGLEANLQRELDLARGGHGISKIPKAARSSTSCIKKRPCPHPTKVRIVGNIKELSPELEVAGAICAERDLLDQ